MAQHRQWFTGLLLVAAPAAFGQASHTSEFDGALAHWREQRGASWRVSVDQGTGQAELLWGGSSAPAFEPVDDAGWFALARHALADAQALHGIEAQTLIEQRVLSLPLGMVGTSDKQTVRFRQVVRGVSVEDGAVNVLFDARGRLLSVQTHALPGVASLDVSASVGADEADRIARRAFTAEKRVPGSVVAAPELVIAQIEGEERRVPQLAWKVDVQWLPADMQPEGVLYLIDARSGAIVRSSPSIHNFDVGGTLYTKATPGTAPDTAANPETQQLMKYARVQSPAGTVYTDANGAFNFAGQAGPLNCTFTYVGTFNNVTNQAGAAESLAQSLTGTANTVVMNPGTSETSTAQANAFVALNLMRDWVRSINPFDATADFVHTAHCNIASTCNAYFDGSSTNYFLSGGGCPNSAYSTVIAHEDGHWLNVLYGTGNGGDGIGEGNADVFAMYLYDSPIVAQDFFGVGAPIRTGLNTRPFCGDCCGGCYGEVHYDGEPWMGAAWKVRANLNSVLGDAAGDALSNALFMGWMNAYNQTQIKSVIESQWLTLDDNDGNIGNGTPHYFPIDAGFVAQGFPGVAFDPLTLSALTQLPDTTDQNGPYTVQVTAQSNIATTITGATLRYRAGWSGSFASAPMAPLGGDVWSASIPGQAAPTKVFYYVEATESAGNTATYPKLVANAYFFGVGSVQNLMQVDFESASDWSASAASNSIGGWTRADPLGTLNLGQQAQPEFDATPGSGVACFFTGQGTSASNANEADVDGGPRELTTPAIAIYFGNAQIEFAYWFYNDDGDDSLAVQASINGGTWSTLMTINTSSSTWRSARVDLGGGIASGASVSVRFSVSDTPNNSVTEAAIDDVRVSTLTPGNCTQPALFCAPKIDSLFCVPRIACAGYARVSGTQPMTLSLNGAASQRNGLLFYGYGTNLVPFKGGVLCCATPLRRTLVQNSGGSPSGTDCTGTMTFDFNAHIRSGIDTNLVAGSACAAQWYYRDPLDQFELAISDAVSFTICP